MLNSAHVLKRFSNLQTTAQDRTTAIGAVISALFCPICFPALAGIASALGLSFLSKYEGWFLVLFHIFSLISAFSVWRGYQTYHNRIPLLLSGLGILLIFGALYQLVPIYALVYIGIILLVGGAFANAYYIKSYQCICENPHQI